MWMTQTVSELYRQCRGKLHANHDEAWCIDCHQRVTSGGGYDCELDAHSNHALIG